MEHFIVQTQVIYSQVDQAQQTWWVVYIGLWHIFFLIANYSYLKRLIVTFSLWTRGR